MGWFFKILGAHDTTIYQLVVRNMSYDAYFSFLFFWATFGGKMGVAITATRAPDGLGSPNLTKKFAHCVNLLYYNNRYREIIFSKFSGVNLNPHLKFVKLFSALYLYLSIILTQIFDIKVLKHSKHNWAACMWIYCHGW